MNVLQQERFSRLQFPVHKITAKTPVELFQILPGLRRFFQNVRTAEIEVKGEDTIRNADGQKIKKPYSYKIEGKEANYRGLYPDDLVKVIKYIVFVYDPDSDLIQEYPGEPGLLKDAAAKEAGFKRLRDGEWPQYVQDIIDFKEKQVVGWIMDYLAVKKNPIFTEIKFIDEELLALYRSRARALQKEEVKGDLMNLIKTRLDEREVLIKRFYAEHLDLKKVTQDQLYPVSPENVYLELKVPPEFAKVRQEKDVLKDTGIEKVSN